MKIFELHMPYEMMEIVDILVSKNQIKKKTFLKNEVTYLCVFNETEEKYLLPELKTKTNNLVKIKQIINSDDDWAVGTDKPIGSKSAIDEN